tara:strand:+ start:1288 stop:1884 length:597 start_codon:yes stop_codon:yes gene_type:complete
LIDFQTKNNSQPYKIFEEYYLKALEFKQPLIEAILIASYSTLNSEVDARFVNLKIVDDDEFIFFSNYESPKSIQFDSHDQISAVLYWSKINVQIRIKALIKKVPEDFSNEYFKNRNAKKNALAISSKQSLPIEAYGSVLDNFHKTMESGDLTKRPNYWGGFSFTPYYFEFWEGRESRLNKRDSYQVNNGEWHHSILQP